MTFRNKIEQEYFEWLYNYVCKGRAHDKVSYKKLFYFLYDTEFSFYIRNDLNRAMDGIDLRYRFSIVKHDDHIMDILDGPCSVLEMMVALAVRCEETIMSDPRYGDRTSQWFWNMLSNLGLSYMTDERYDEKVAAKKIYDFMERRYEPNGKGGLFYIRDCREDLRDIEIWTQLSWYLDKYI